MDFDYINECAKKFRLSVERDAFMEGVRLGFQLASDRYLEYLSELEKRRANSIIVIDNNEASDWISVNDRLPDVDTMVLIYTTNEKFGISSMYIPKDCYGKVLGDKKWRGSNAMQNAITHWQPIVSPIKKKL